MEGDILYKNYIDARDKWLLYAHERASINFNNRLKDIGKKYNKDSYYLDTCESRLKSDVHANVNNMTNDIKKIYKKLSLVFHPDKFIKTDVIFKCIYDISQDNNYMLLTFIDLITADILEYDNIEILNEIFSCKEKLSKFYEYSYGKNISFTELLNSYKSASKLYEHESKLPFEPESFMNSTEYKWFCGNINIKQSCENQYYSDDELISHLNTDVTDDELNYYLKHGSDNVKKYIKKIKQEKNERVTIQREKVLLELIDNYLSKDRNANNYDDIIPIITNLNYVDKEKYNDKYKLVLIKYEELFKFTDCFNNIVIKINNNDINSIIAKKIFDVFNKYLSDENLNSIRHDMWYDYTSDLTHALKIIYDNQHYCSLYDISTLYIKIIEHIVNVIKNINIESYAFNAINKYSYINDISDAINTQINEYIEKNANDHNKLEKLLANTNKKIVNIVINFITLNKENYERLYNKYVVNTF